MTTHADLIRRLETLEIALRMEGKRKRSWLISEAATALAEAGEDREDAERWRHTRDNYMGLLLTIYPTTETCDVGIDYACDRARGRG